MVHDTRKVKIYTLKHPDTLEVRYVGKTVRSLSRRLGNHITNAKGNKHNRHLSNWILSILALGKRPIIELIEEVDDSIWQEREKYWITQYSNLINLTEGGDGCAGFLHDEETRIKCGLINKGRRHTDEFKEKISRMFKGRELTEEHKTKIGISNKGKIRTPETLQKLSDSHKGIKQSEESKRKKSETIKAWWAKRKSIEDIVES